jgi:putative glycosyltransferase (TIGR04372 family)
MQKSLAMVELLLAVPVVLLVRVLRPLVMIRFGGLPSEGLGPLALVMELYLCERDAGVHGRRTLDLFFRKPQVCNRQLEAMWLRAVPVHRFARAVARINEWFPGGQCHRLPFGKIPLDIYGLMPTSRLHLSFTPDEEQRGHQALRALGISDGTPIVCFHARDPADQLAQGGGSLDDVQEHRNSDIRTQLPAMGALTHRGYVAVRMGAVVEAPLPVEHPRIIDYATQARSEFLDVFLCARCRFFVGDGDGLTSMATAFRRPLVLVNFAPLEYLDRWNPSYLVLPKKLWLISEHRFLTFREILTSEVRGFYQTARYRRSGIEWITNTPEEITAAVLEMDERLNGTWQTTEEDEQLQRAFWGLFERTEGAARAHLADRWPDRSGWAFGSIRARIGAAFLREHRALLLGDTLPAAPRMVTIS